jgi:hypothetical protein
MLMIVIICTALAIAAVLIAYIFFFKQENFFMKHKSENKAIMNSYLPNQLGIIDIQDDELPFIDTDRSVSLKYNSKRYNRNDKQKTNNKGNVHTKHLL